MRILFLCSALEPGRDGVGDYCRLLSGPLAEKGVQCAILALNDGSISEVYRGESAGPKPSLIRLPSRFNWPERLRLASAAIHEFQPDCVSLQFVCYGFHPKGLIFGLAPRLRQLLAGLPVHIMFHELWIGDSTTYGWKDRAVGYFQKRLILHTARRLRPVIVHTTTPVYRHLLRAGGIHSELLPLFGNIPLVQSNEPSWIYNQLRRHHIDITPANRDKFIFAGIFGSVHPELDPNPFLDRLLQVARKTERVPVLLAVGRIGAAGARLLAGVASRYGADLPCFGLGEQPPELISQFLQTLDFGIATSPWALIEKSGATAAMLDHGLPVAVPRDDWRLRSGTTPQPTPNPLLFRGDETFFAAFESGFSPPAPSPRLSEIADRLIRALSFANRSTQPDNFQHPSQPMVTPRIA